jgi:hypothetical protein
VKPKLQSNHKQEQRKLLLLKKKQKGSEQEVTREQETDMSSQISVQRRLTLHPEERLIARTRKPKARSSQRRSQQR